MSDGGVGWVWCLALDMGTWLGIEWGSWSFLGLEISLEGC